MQKERKKERKKEREKEKKRKRKSRRKKDRKKLMLNTLSLPTSGKITSDIKTNRLKRTLFNKTRQYTLQIINISNLLICFCSFTCPIHEKDNVSNICILYCLVFLNSVIF